MSLVDVLKARQSDYRDSVAAIGCTNPTLSLTIKPIEVQPELISVHDGQGYVQISRMKAIWLIMQFIRIFDIKPHEYIEPRTGGGSLD